MTTTAIQGLSTRDGRESWLDRSECGGFDRFTEKPHADQQAHCNACPVVEACRELGVSLHLDVQLSRKPHDCIGGVFGGLTPEQLAAEIRLRRTNPRTTGCLRCGQHWTNSQFPSGGRICGNCEPYLPTKSDLHGTARGYLAGCECGQCLNGRPLRTQRADYLAAEVMRLLKRPEWCPDLIARKLGYGGTTALLRALVLAERLNVALQLRRREKAGR